jgi:hypothetical protein
MSSAIFSINKLRGLSATLKSTSEESVKEMADVAQTYAVDHVQVLTGETQASIHTEVDGETATVYAGGASLFLEYGTVHARAFPFLRPAVAAAEESVSGSKLKEIFESKIG